MLIGYLLGILTETVTAVYVVCLIMGLTTSKTYFKLSQAKVKAFAQSNLYYSIVTSLTAVFSISVSKHPTSAVALDSKAEILLHFNF